MKLIASPLLLLSLVLGSCASTPEGSPPDANIIPVHYLEIISPDVDETCASLSAIHGVTFAEPNPALGNSRMASLADGGRIGVRAPMRATEEPIIRIYARTPDVQAATEAAEAAGCQIAMWPMALPGNEGLFSIYLQGGNEYGLWQPGQE